jgi:hypothetical protein
MSTTVTGNIKNLATGAVGSSSNAFVRFWLRGCRGNQPRVPAAGAIAPQVHNGHWYVDLAANASGVVAGTIYSTRDAAGTGDGDIDVAGIKTAVWYGMVVYADGVPGPEVPVHAKSGATLNVNNVTAISTPAVSVAPTGDNTYLRLDGGNSPVTGPVEFAGGITGNVTGNVTGNITGNVTSTGTSSFNIIRSKSPIADVKAFGAVGDGTTDDTTAVAAAIASGASTVFFPAGTYKVTAKLTQPTAQAWVGDGGQRATTIKKGFNGDLVDMGDRGRIADLNFDCQGATYTGRGIYVPSGFSQKIERVRCADSVSASLEFANNVGGGCNVLGFEGGTTSPLTVAAIKCRDNQATPRFFDGIWLSGGMIDFASGGNGNSVVNFYVNNIITDANTQLLHLVNGRVASGTDPIVISGANNVIQSVGFSGQVQFVSAQGNKLVGCVYGTGFTEDSSNCQYNEISDQLQSYTPTWNQPSGTQPALGDGTIVGAWQRQGYVCTARIRLVMGGTTTYGNNTVAYQFSLPFKGHAASEQRLLGGYIVDSSTGNQYACQVLIAADSAIATLGYINVAVDSDTPFAWATGDTIDIQVTYMVR